MWVTVSAVFGPPKPILSAFAAKSGRAGRDPGATGAAVRFSDDEGPVDAPFDPISFSILRRFAF